MQPVPTFLGTPTEFPARPSLTLIYLTTFACWVKYKELKAWVTEAFSE